MIALVLALLFAVMLVRPMRGRYSYLPHARYQKEWLVPTGFAVQIAAPMVADAAGLGEARSLVLLAWMFGGSVLLVACWANRPNAGFRLAAIGVSLNMAVIALNGGMPVSVSALEYLGLSAREDQLAALTPLYHLSDVDTRLLVLGDILPVPGPALVRSVVSLGDMLLMVAIVLIVLEATRALARSR